VLSATSLVAGIGLALGLSLWDSALGRHIPPESLSRVSAYDWFGSLVAGPLAMSVVGPLADAVGTGTVLIATSALFLAGDVLLASLPSLRAVT
jgi:hypothetical protein